MSNQDSNIINDDPKCAFKQAIKDYILVKITNYNDNKRKSKIGRPNSIPIDKCLDAILFVLIENVTWHIASKLALNSYKYKATLNRRFNEWVNAGLINNCFDDNLNAYIQDAKIDELYIDSTDVQNKSLSKDDTYVSFKLKKQAIRVTIVGDDNRIPIAFSVNKAHQPDTVLGYDLLMSSDLNLNPKQELLIFGDKGYHISEEKKDNLLESKNLKLITPKKRYKKRHINLQVISAKSKGSVIRNE